MPSDGDQHCEPSCLGRPHCASNLLNQHKSIQHTNHHKSIDISLYSLACLFICLLCFLSFLSVLPTTSTYLGRVPSYPLINRDENKYRTIPNYLGELPSVLVPVI